MSDKTVRRRVVVCIDGTWFDGNGRCGNGNASSIYRLFMSAKEGIVKNNDGGLVKQIVKYFSGTGLQKPALHKVDDDVSAEGYENQVQDVYNFCCDNVKSSDDEIWLFGFSRGAYVARVVALFLENPSLYDSFKRPVKQGWRSNMKAFRSKSFRSIQDLKAGQWDAGDDSKGVRVHFLGLFDTITPNNADFNVASVIPATHVRHALGLNEKRKSHSPLRFDTAKRDEVSTNKDWVEAWFAGVHTDIGGGELHDGLSLYPLQWMLVEGKAHGLELTEDPSSDLLKQTQSQTPLDLVFPLPESHPNIAPDGSIVPKPSDHPEPWTFTYGNGVEITMYDLRSTHNQGENNEPPRKKLQSRRGTPAAKHFARLNEKPGNTSGSRQVFGEDQFGGLLGYGSNPSGSAIVHPSVYFLLDSHAHLKLRRGLKDVQHHLLKFRRNADLHYVQGSVDPWIRHEFQATVGCCRILVCGNTGVGKSTLLNRVFGMELSGESSSRRSKHDIDKEFETESHPGIILHDSEGFQCGADKEVTAFKQFLKKRSWNKDHSQRLHAIWLCIPTEEVRPVQVALANVLERVAETAPHIPIVIVGTKKDRFCRAEQEPEAIVLPRRERMFKNEFESHEDTRQFWPKLHVRYTFVSYDDPKSIQGLIHLTMDLLDSAAELGLVAAQVQDVDAKIDNAVIETFEVLRSTMITAAVGLGSGMVSIAATPTWSRVLCHKIAYGCFGIPAKHIEGISATLNSVVWANLAGFMTRELAQVGMWGGAALLTVGSLGLGAKVWKGVALLDAPAAARMLVKCACDLILILDQAFRDGGKSLTLDKIGDVSAMYARSSIKAGPAEGKSRRKAVHEEVNNTFTLSSRGQNATFRLGEEYRQKVKAIIKRWRWKDDGGFWNKTKAATANSVKRKKVGSGSFRKEKISDPPGIPELPPRRPMTGPAPKASAKTTRVSKNDTPQTKITVEPEDNPAGQRSTKAKRPGNATGQDPAMTQNQTRRGERQQPARTNRDAKRARESRDDGRTNAQSDPSDTILAAMEGVSLVAGLGGTAYEIYASASAEEPPTPDEMDAAAASMEAGASGLDYVQNSTTGTHTAASVVPAEPDAAVEADQCQTLDQDKPCDERGGPATLREDEEEEDVEDSGFEEQMTIESQYTDEEDLDAEEQTDMASEYTEDEEDQRYINEGFEDDPDHDDELDDGDDLDDDYLSCG